MSWPRVNTSGVGSSSVGGVELTPGSGRRSELWVVLPRYDISAAAALTGQQSLDFGVGVLFIRFLT